MAVVLGKTGRNFAAGMSGGVAYVWDLDGRFEPCVNKGNGSILLEPVVDPEDVSLLRDLIERHARYTDSDRAAEVLSTWDETLPQFVKVISVEYKNMMAELAKEAGQLVAD